MPIRQDGGEGAGKGGRRREAEKPERDPFHKPHTARRLTSQSPTLAEMAHLAETEDAQTERSHAGKDARWHPTIPSLDQLPSSLLLFLQPTAFGA